MNSFNEQNVFMISSSSESADDTNNAAITGKSFNIDGDDEIDDQSFSEDDIVFQPSTSSGLSRSQEPRKYDGPISSAHRVKTLLKFPRHTLGKDKPQSTESSLGVFSSEEDICLMSDSDGENVKYIDGGVDRPTDVTSKDQTSDASIYEWDTEHEIIHYNEKKQARHDTTSHHKARQSHSKHDVSRSHSNSRMDKATSSLFQQGRRKSSETNHSIYSISSSSDSEKADSPSLFTEDEDDGETCQHNTSTSSFSPILPDRSYNRLSISRKRKLDESNLSMTAEPNEPRRAVQDLQKIDPRLNNAVVLLSPMRRTGQVGSDVAIKGLNTGNKNIHIDRELHKEPSSTGDFSDEFELAPLNRQSEKKLSDGHNTRHANIFEFHTNSESESDHQRTCMLNKRKFTSSTSRLARKKQRLESSDSDDAVLSGADNTNTSVGEDEFLSLSGSKRRLHVPNTSKTISAGTFLSESDTGDAKQTSMVQAGGKPESGDCNNEYLPAGANKAKPDGDLPVSNHNNCDRQDNVTSSNTSKNKLNLCTSDGQNSHHKKAAKSGKSNDGGEKSTEVFGGLRLGEEYPLDDLLCENLVCDDWTDDNEDNEKPLIIEVVSRDEYDRDCKNSKLGISLGEVSTSGNHTSHVETMFAKPDPELRTPSSVGEKVSYEQSDRPRSTTPTNYMEFSQCLSPSDDDIILLTDEDDDTFFGELTQSVIKAEPEDETLRLLEDEDWNEDDIKAIDASCQMHYEEIEKRLFAEGDDELLKVSKDFELTQKPAQVTDDGTVKHLDTKERDDEAQHVYEDKNTTEPLSGKSESMPQLTVVLHDIQKSAHRKEILDSEGVIASMKADSSKSGMDSGFKDESKALQASRWMSSSSDEEQSEEPIPSISKKNIPDLEHQDFETDEEDWVLQIEDPIPSKPGQQVLPTAYDSQCRENASGETQRDSNDNHTVPIQKATTLKLFPKGNTFSQKKPDETEFSLTATKSVGLGEKTSSTLASNKASLSLKSKKMQSRFGPSKHLRIQKDPSSKPAPKQADTSPLSSDKEKKTSFHFLTLKGAKTDMGHTSSSTDSFELPELTKTSFYGKHTPPAWDSVQKHKQAEVSALFTDKWQKVGHHRSRRKSGRPQSPVGLTQGIANAMNEMKKRDKSLEKKVPDDEVPEFDLPPLPEVDSVTPPKNSLFIGESLTGKPPKRVAHAKRSISKAEESAANVSATKVTTEKPKVEKSTVKDKTRKNDAKIQHAVELLKDKIGSINANTVKDAYDAVKIRKSLETKDEQKKSVHGIKDISNTSVDKISDESLDDIVKKLRKRWHSEKSKFPKLTTAEQLRKRPRRDSTSTLESKTETNIKQTVHSHKSKDSLKKSNAASDIKLRQEPKLMKEPGKESSLKCPDDVRNIQKEVLVTKVTSGLKQNEIKKHKKDLEVKQHHKANKVLSSRTNNNELKDNKIASKSDHSLKKSSALAVLDKIKLKPSEKAVEKVQRTRKDSTSSVGNVECGTRDANQPEKDLKISTKAERVVEKVQRTRKDSTSSVGNVECGISRDRNQPEKDLKISAKAERAVEKVQRTRKDSTSSVGNVECGISRDGNQPEKDLTISTRTERAVEKVQRTRNNSTLSVSSAQCGISEDGKRSEKDLKVATKSGCSRENEGSEKKKSSREKDFHRSEKHNDKSSGSYKDNKTHSKSHVSKHARKDTTTSDKHKAKHKENAVNESDIIEMRVDKADRGQKYNDRKEDGKSEKSKTFRHTTNDPQPSKGSLSAEADKPKHQADIYNILNLKSPPLKPQEVQPESRRDKGNKDRKSLNQQKLTNTWSIDGVLRKILMWSPNWFAEYEKVRHTPPVMGKEPLLPLLETYSSYKDYMKIMTAHFLLETWFHIYNGWKERVSQNKMQSHSLYPVHLNLNIAEGFSNKSQERVFMDLACQGVFPQAELSRGLPVMEGDLVKVDLKYRDQANQLQTKVVNGYVQRSFKLFKGNHNIHKVIADVLKNGPQSSAVVHVELRLLFRKIRICHSEYFSLAVFDNIIHDMRQYSGLAYLPRSSLCRDILEPTNMEVFMGPGVADDPSLSQRYNESQAMVINMVSAGILQTPGKPKIYLLQGPPGTGKSHVITGLIERIICQGVKESPRILLCAPSNAAVDELARRLKKLRPTLQKCSLSFVRFGKQTSIHKDVAEFSLDALFNKQWMKYHSTDRLELPSVRNALIQIESKLKGFHMARENLQKQGKITQANHLDSEIEKLEKKKSSIGGLSDKRQLSASQENQIKRKILMSSQVVCCTLNSAGSSHLLNYLTPQSGETTTSFFNCVIIDEAAQCIEADTLIPLQYGINKVVLVGDPEQLPPTVISKEAQDMNYGQSLFERYYSHFKMSVDNPIMMLTTQYRMHDDVCSFPNNHVYMGRLGTDRDVSKERNKHYPLKHYAVFDVRYGQEYREASGALCNGAEASFVARLCDYLLKRHRYLRPEKIGVITPYQKQRKIILDDLQSVKNHGAIEVGTVDGFQGREKDVIIMSCVRACSASGGIGFMTDRRRMNVALTRAKYACYVVGHMYTLKCDKNWHSLVEDAKQRKVLITTQKPSEDNKAFDWLKK